MKYSIEDEGKKQSDFSPGVVENRENLLRVIYGPEHIVDNKVIESAISLSDLKERGFSLDREKYAKPSVVKDRINRQMENKPECRKEANIANLACLEVRKIKHDEERALIVIDDGTSEENPAHASIYSLKSGRAKLKQLRAKLLPLLQNLHTYEQIFSK